MSTPIIDFTKIDYEDLKQEIINYISNTTDFNTYNFESSNITLLVNLLSYVTTLLSYYQNQAVNENYLDSAELRKNVLSIIKLLNYTPDRTQSSYVYVDLVGTPTTPGNDIVIPRYSLFSAGEYNFYNTEEIVLESSSSYTQNNIKLTEGTITQLSFTGDGSSYQKFKIEDTLMGDYLRVWSYELDSNGQETTTEVDWDLYTETLLLTDPVNARIFFLEELETGYQIMTGNGNFGMKVPNTLSLNVDYLQSSGADANEIPESDFSFSDSDSATNFSSLSITFSTDTGYVTTQSSGGQAKETLDSIKFNAPKFFSTQGRAVTADDYLAIMSSNSSVSKVNVLGGEDLATFDLGKVYIYAKPVSGKTFNVTEKATLKSYIEDYAVLGISITINDPEYIYLEVDSTIRYTGDRPTTSNITTDLDALINDTNQEFGTYFKYSELIGTIDDSDSLISGNLTTIKKYRYITADDVDSGNDYEFYLTKYLDSDSGAVRFYIEEWDTGSGSGLNNTIVESDLTDLSVNETTGLVSFTYAGFDFNNYEYKCYFYTDSDDLFLNGQQILYLEDDDVELTFDSVSV